MPLIQAYPMQIVLEDQLYHFEKILKDDFFSVNVLYRNARSERQVLKLSDFRFLLGLVFRPLAILVSRREYRMYQRVADVAGVPRLGPRFGLRGYFHEYIQGKTLYELPKTYRLPDDFFRRLRQIIDEIHRRRIVYLDLQKRGNIILSNEGHPYLIDYQVSLFFKKREGWLGRILDRLFNYLKREDIYHLYKHKRRFQGDQMTDDELRLAERSRLNQHYHRYVGTPLRKIKRLIYPKGSNEIIWYKWKRMKDRSERVP